MIEKLSERGILDQYENCYGKRYPSNKEMMDKINELIDRVNSLEQSDEPKFKVGDWVTLHMNTSNKPTVRQIADITVFRSHQYWTTEGKWFGDGTKAAHWTIQDARNGDVLVSDADQPFLYNGCLCEPHVGSHCGLNIGGVFMVCDTNAWTNRWGVHPATKGQRDALFAEMTKAGYEWIEESKELRKIPTPADVGFEDLGKAWESEAKEISLPVSELEKFLMLKFGLNIKGAKNIASEIISIIKKDINNEKI